jgi:hypothetical protein
MIDAGPDRLQRTVGKDVVERPLQQVREVRDSEEGRRVVRGQRDREIR